MKLSSDMKCLLERNITLHYWLSALMWGRFFIPVLALFYIASQVTLAEFSIIMGVFAATTMILEIPTGVLADLLGKKKTLLLSRFCYVVEVSILAFGNGFWLFLIAKMISGVGVSLSSGTTSALLFDTLKRLRKTSEHKRIAGTTSFITNVSMAFVFIIGAYLFTLSPKLPAYLSLPFILGGFILTFWQTEPYPPARHLSLSSAYAHLCEGLRYFIRNRYLVYLALLSFFVSSYASMMLSLSSSYLVAISFPLIFIGALSFIGSLCAAYSGKSAHWLITRFGEQRSFFILQILTLCSLSGLALMIPLWGALFLLIVYALDSFFGVLSSDFANHHIPTSHRATVLSIGNMFDNIGITLLFPLIGWTIARTSFSYTFFAYAFLLFFFFVLLFFSLGRKLSFDKR